MNTPSNIQILPDEKLYSPRALCDKFPGTFTESSLCRWRREGSGPEFVAIQRQSGGASKIRYPESAVLKWLNAQIVSSTAEIKIDPSRYAHLPAARAKSLAVRKARREAANG